MNTMQWHGNNNSRRVTMMTRMLVVTALVLAAMNGSAVNFFPVVGSSYNVNVLRRFDPTTYALMSSAAVVASANGSVLDPGTNVIDGTRAGTRLQVAGSGDPNASLTVRITLDQLYSINKVWWYQADGISWSQQEIRTSADGSTWSVASAQAPTPSTQGFATFAARDTKYIEYQVWGALAQYTDLREIRAFAASSGPGIPTSGGYNFAWNGITNVKLDSNWLNYHNAQDMVDLTIDTGCAGSGNGNDARSLVDLGSIQNIFKLMFTLYPDQTWGNGIKVEGSADNVSFAPLYDTSSSTGWNFAVNLPSGQNLYRYLRITDKGAWGNAMQEIEVFTQEIPEPATLGLLALGGLAALRRRSPRA